jgi:hypothetical protein
VVEERVKQKSKRKAWLLAAAVIGAMAAVAIVFLLVSASAMFREMRGARESLKEYSKALISMDYARAYSLRASEFQKTESETKFEDQQRLAVSEFGNLEKVVLQTAHNLRNQNGWTCTIHGRIIYERTQFPVVVRMKKEGDRWLIFDYKATTE